MATVAHTIYSHYDPKDREQLEQETGQIPDNEEIIDSAESWEREASRNSLRQRRAPPPQFVPATFSYEDWGNRQASSSKLPGEANNARGSDLGGWYRSLSRSRDCCSDPEIDRKPPVPTISHSDDAKTTFRPILEKKNKNNWFIMRAIQSEPPSAPRSPTPSLADMLARDPPPLPTEKKYTPPVWLEIGPSNKGFVMLQQSGWNEGEALGPDVIRRRPWKDILPESDIIPTSRKGKAPEQLSRSIVRREVREVNMGDDDVSELRNVDVIDLTLSDSDSDSDSDSSVGRHPVDEDTDQKPVVKVEDERSPPIDNPGSESPPSQTYDTSGRRALLTPIATVLKSDRLGIGLKAKTVGPYKASQKRVTHNAAAMAAHIKAAEETRKHKRKLGRGRRGFECQRKKEEANRKLMLAYLNS